jgi:hypothetical protein
MLTTYDTRRDSLAAKRQRAANHGWNVTALPLTASIRERLELKAQADDELGDQADEALSRLRVTA